MTRGYTIRPTVAASGAWELLSVAVADALARALGEVHAAGVIHGDLQPEHMLFTPDQAYLIDRSRARADRHDRTDIGSVWTLRRNLKHIAPEETGRVPRSAARNDCRVAFAAPMGAASRPSTADVLVHRALLKTAAAVDSASGRSLDQRENHPRSVLAYVARSGSLRRLTRISRDTDALSPPPGSPAGLKNECSARAARKAGAPRRLAPCWT